MKITKLFGFLYFACELVQSTKLWPLQSVMPNSFKVMVTEEILILSAIYAVHQ